MEICNEEDVSEMAFSSIAPRQILPDIAYDIMRSQSSYFHDPMQCFFFRQRSLQQWKGRLEESRVRLSFSILRHKGSYTRA